MFIHPFMKYQTHNIKQLKGWTPTFINFLKNRDWNKLLYYFPIDKFPLNILSKNKTK